MCAQCLCWFKSIHRFISISGFVKNKGISGYMRWGIIFGPRYKLFPSGMYRYLPSKILNLDPGNLNPSTNIYIYIISRQSTLGYLGPAHCPWWTVWFRWNPANSTSPLIFTQSQGFSIDHGNFIIFLWFLYVTYFPISIETRLPETVSDGLRRSPALLKP